MKPLADIAGMIDVTEDHHRSMEMGLGQRIVRTDRDGSFLVSIGGEPHLKVMVSTGKGWDHVSVSLANRCPTWGEMSAVHRVCFRPHETAMQLHVPPAEHVDCHPYCLHLWRPTGRRRAIPRPPKELVGGRLR